MTAEHLWSEWMGSLSQSKGFTFRQKDEHGKILKEWHSQSIDLTAKVVCEPCNGGWMSRLENQYAKPALTDLIIGNKALTISQSRANSIALFAFKSAVIIDHMRRDKPPFFRRSARHEFRRALTIPDGVQMWLAGFLPRGSGRFNTYYSDVSIDPRGRLDLYVCTYGVRHFVFQVVAARYAGIPSFSPKPGFEYLAVPFWPELVNISQGRAWPPQDVLRSRSDFDKFSERWGEISIE
jgi:hypothetical protein